jgi:hypothetical protein
VLIDVGHVCGVTVFRSSGSRLLTQDTCGHWVLWDTSTTAQVASGTAACVESNCVSADLGGTTVAVQTSAGLELRSSADGNLVSTITAPRNWWKVATDGSYVASGTGTALSIWTPAGQSAATRAGNYALARAFAAPSELRIAGGPAGSTVIEKVAPNTGAATNSAAFSGQFYSWFLDGDRFLTNTGNTVWTYTKDAIQEGIMALPTIENLTGQGHWLWTQQSSTVGYPLRVYAVGGDVANVTIYDQVNYAIPSGLTVGMFSSGPDTVSERVLDLSGTTLNVVNNLPPIPYPTGFYASSPSRWMIGTQRGVIREGGASVPGGGRSFGCGQVYGIAGGGNRVAIATATGTIDTFDVNTRTAETMVAFASSHVELSGDGTVLAASGNSNDSQYQRDRSLKLFSLPGGSETRRWPYTFGGESDPPWLYDFVLARSGSVVGQLLLRPGRTWNLTRTVMGTQASTPIWSDMFQPSSTGDPAPMQLSPDGTLIAAGTGSRSSSVATNIYRNGTLITALVGWPVAWLDNQRLLASKYSGSVNSPTYTGAVVYDTTGAILATLASLPDIRDAQVVSADVIYSPRQNKTYSTTTGAAIWTTPEAGTAWKGAVAGSRVVFASGNQVLIKPL